MQKRAAFLLLFPLLATAEAAQVNGLRMWASPENTRLVFDVSAAVSHKVFALTGPDRLVIDLQDTSLPDNFPALDTTGSLLKGMRSAGGGDNTLRIVFDLEAPVRAKSFSLKPNEKYGHRLVLDLYNAGAATPVPVVRTAPEETVGGARELVVAIDAGHGGDDPGALGKGGTQEKEVVLAIAQRLEKLIAAEPGMRPVMVRRGDYYVSLRDRMRKAREHKADLFVSIHADSFRDRRARGASVYVLSQRGASSEAAQFLADSENNADLIGGVSLEDKDDLLASVLVDLSQNATLAASMDVGGGVLRQLQRVGRVHKGRVEQAGFVVLKSPDVPSILVETGFISNPAEETDLRDTAYQQRLAEAMLQGVRNYFGENDPARGVVAERERKHTIQQGETLTAIAQLYKVSTQRIRASNGLSSDELRVGQVLRIPLVGDS